MIVKKNRLLADIVSSLFIILFVYAALTKVQDFQKFRVELGKSPLLNVFAGYVSVLIPSIELIIATLLVVKRIQYYALFFSFSLMAIFSGYIAIILKFSPYIPCSCGGILQNMTWFQHLIFNIAYMVIGAIAILLYPKREEDLTRDKKGRLHP